MSRLPRGPRRSWPLGVLVVVMHGRPARVARSSWILAFVVAVAGPVVLGELATGAFPASVWETLAVGVGLVGFTLLVVSVVLIARIPSLVSAFGIERTMRTHPRGAARGAAPGSWL